MPLLVLLFRRSQCVPGAQLGTGPESESCAQGCLEKRVQGFADLEQEDGRDNRDGDTGTSVQLHGSLAVLFGESEC